MADLLKKLEGGDRRSIGRVAEVVKDVTEDPALFKRLIEGLFAPDPVVRMRAADAIEKISADHPEHLRPYKKKLIELAAESRQQEVRWHLAQMLPRLSVNLNEKKAVIEILTDYLTDQSKIVVVSAMQALSDFAADDNSLRRRVLGMLQKLSASGSPAVKSRGEKLIEKL